MEDDIIRKVRDELQIRITSERQVVYILVEIRKLMERLKDGTNLFALRFFCDWAVHAELDQQGAQRIVRRFDKHQAVNELLRQVNTGEELNPDMSFFPELIETVRLDKFRGQLGCYLGRHNLPATIADDHSEWANFLTYYAAVIEDCPLRCRDPGLMYTDEVTVNVIHSPQGPTTDGTENNLVIRWSWMSKITGIVSMMETVF